MRGTLINNGGSFVKKTGTFVNKRWTSVNKSVTFINSRGTIVKNRGTFLYKRNLCQEERNSYNMQETWGGLEFVPYLWVGLAGSRRTQRGVFGGAGGRPGRGERPPSFSEPGEWNEGSRRPRRTLRWLSEDKIKYTSICLWWLPSLMFVDSFKCWRVRMEVWFVMDKPAAHREAVGLVFPHPDIRTSESHADRWTHEHGYWLSLINILPMSTIRYFKLSLTQGPGSVSWFSYRRRQWDYLDQPDSSPDSSQKPTLTHTGISIKNQFRITNCTHTNTEVCS